MHDTEANKMYVIERMSVLSFGRPFLAPNNFHVATARVRATCRFDRQLLFPLVSNVEGAAAYNLRKHV
ncbi:hypothetical protein ABIB99_008295 [Bradyrhizobium sp. LA6.1]